MSERGSIPGGQDRAGGDPSPLGVRTSPLGGVDGVEGALLASLSVSRALPREDGGQEAAQALVEEAWDVEEEEEEMEGMEEAAEKEEGEEEGEEAEAAAEFEFELEDQEEDEHQSEEGDGNEEEMEEEEESGERDENGQENAEADAGHGTPAEQLRDLVHSLLFRVRHNHHVLVRPQYSRMRIRSRSRPPSDPAEGPAPSQGQEDLGEGGEVWRGEDQSEGTLPWEPQQSAEGAASQMAEEPAAEALSWAREALADGASESWEAGVCGADLAEAGGGRPSPQALAAPARASGSKAGRARRWPLAVKQRVRALKNLQAQYAQVEAQFYKDLYDLEKKYAAFCQPLFDKRADIINAVHEPTEGECRWQVGVQEGAWEETEREPEGKGQTDGIPHFWLTAFKNVKILRSMIRGNDERVLEHLKDVKIKFPGVEEPMSFTIEFLFKSNEYFFNKVLTKTYRMRSGPDDADPFFSKGPEIISSTGCEIYWKDGKDLTVKTLELQKCEGPGGVIPATRKVPSSSFFTYFYPPDPPEGRALDVATDYKLGSFFREVLVPKSVLFFTKEASVHQYENSDEEVQEAAGKEEGSNEEPEGGPEKDPDPAEGSPGEPSCQA